MINNYNHVTRNNSLAYLVKLATVGPTALPNPDGAASPAVRPKPAEFTQGELDAMEGAMQMAAKGNSEAVADMKKQLATAQPAPTKPSVGSASTSSAPAAKQQPNAIDPHNFDIAVPENTDLGAGTEASDMSAVAPELSDPFAGANTAKEPGWFGSIANNIGSHILQRITGNNRGSAAPTAVSPTANGAALADAADESAVESIVGQLNRAPESERLAMAQEFMASPEYSQKTKDMFAQHMANFTSGDAMQIDPNTSYGAGQLTGKGPNGETVVGKYSDEEFNNGLAAMQNMSSEQRQNAINDLHNNPGLTPAQRQRLSTAIPTLVPPPSETRADVPGNIGRLADANANLQALRQAEAEQTQPQTHDNTMTMGTNIMGGAPIQAPSVPGPISFDASKLDTNLSSAIQAPNAAGLQAAIAQQDSNSEAAKTEAGPITTANNLMSSAMQKVAPRGISGNYAAGPEAAPVEAPVAAQEATPAEAAAPVTAPSTTPTPQTITADMLSQVDRGRMRKQRRHTGAADLNSEMDRWKTLMAELGYTNMSNADYYRWKKDPKSFTP